MKHYAKYPVEHVGITQYYSAGHRALDLGWKTPNPDIFAADDGVIVSCGVERGTGAIFAVLRHDAAPQGKHVFTRYWHLRSLAVTQGERVKMGQKIGVMGDTGNATGVHLHLEYWITPDTVAVPSAADKALYALDPRGYLYLYPDQTQSAANTGVMLLPEQTEEPEEEQASAPAGTGKAGDAVLLGNVPLYATGTTATVAGKLNGTYYLWEDRVGHGRIRVTNAPERVGVAGQVTGWINESDLGGVKPSPAERKTYTVKSGDTLSGIAAANGMSLSAIAALNPQIRDLNLIYPGQIIFLS